MDENKKNKQCDLHYYIFQQKARADKTNVSFFEDSLKVLQLDAVKYSTMDADLYDNCGERIEDIDHYGMVAGLYWIWKNENSAYIGFSLRDEALLCSKEWLFDQINNGISLIHIKEVGSSKSIEEEYKSLYYGHDIRVAKEVINRDYPYMRECANEFFAGNGTWYPPSVIMRKDVFRKFCLWLFPLLHEISRYCCNDRASIYQNKYLEHLTYYLLPLYITYNKDKFRVSDTDTLVKFEYKNVDHYIPLGSKLTDQIQDLIKHGYADDIRGYIENKSDDANYPILKKISDNYIRQKRYFKSTDLDKNRNIRDLIDTESNRSTQISNSTSKILVFKWNSFNNDVILNSLQSMGFDVDYIQIMDLSIVRQGNKVDILNSYLDDHSFDVVYTTNYIDIMAEACYVHGIPYIAWAYDSPTDLGDRRTLNYDTTNVFLFDSEEAYSLRNVHGYKNVHYMPLAVDSDTYDGMTLDSDEIDRFSASVSFVGQLYDNKLNEYMSYLEDYQKGFLNGLIDYNIGKYGSHGVNTVISMQADRWLGSKKFYNAVFAGESKTRDSIEEESPERILGRVNILLNKSITNRERLLIISMLSNHYDLKLYSNQTHEVCKNAINCGTIDYNTEMPKVFKASKVNLNITLKSIKAGIPLRCLDIMGCHGFLLSNYQKDFDEHFKDGENIALFSSIEEAYDKCKFYLEHDEIRQRVADREYETVKEYYNYQRLFREMFKISGIEHLLP